MKVFLFSIVKTVYNKVRKYFKGREKMGVYQILKDVQDIRKEEGKCAFNGFLEDYLSSIEEEECEVKDILTKMFELDSDLRICVDLHVGINQSVVSNQIIRYKDAFKLKGDPLCIPYIVYGEKQGNERALMLVNGKDDDYLLVKGLYYCMTEPFSMFAECKNDMVAMLFEEEEEVLSVFSRLFKVKAGALQREIDRNHFANYEQLKQLALNKAAALKETIIPALQEADEKEPLIVDAVIQWFLLKKIVYVYYMVNKDILARVHENNIKKQRNQAKINADEVPFTSYSEMWRNSSKPKEL